MNWIKNALFILISSLFLLFLCLEGLRLFELQSELKIKKKSGSGPTIECGDINWPSRFTALAGYSSFKPGEILRWTNKTDFCGESKINSLGYPDHEPIKGLSTVILGDSFVEQAQLSLHKNEKLQDQLKELFLKNKKSERNVLAIGYSGTGQTAQAMMLEEAINDGVTPRDVVLVIVPNDVRDNSHLISSIINNYSPFGSPRPYYVQGDGSDLKLQLPNVNGANFYKNTLIQKLTRKFANRYQKVFGLQLSNQIIFNKRLEQLKQIYPDDKGIQQINYIPKQYDLFFGDPEKTYSIVERAWLATEQSIVRLKNICGSCNFHALLVYQFSSPEFANYSQRFLALLEKHQINHLSQAYDAKFHWKNDGHWNVEGVKDAAQLIFKLLDK